MPLNLKNDMRIISYLTRATRFQQHVVYLLFNIEGLNCFKVITVELFSTSYWKVQRNITLIYVCNPWFYLYNPFLIILCLKWCEWFLIISRKSPPKIFYINWTDEYQWTFKLFLILSYVEKYFMVSAKKWECCFVEINTTWNYKHKILSSLDWTLKNFNYNAV